MFHEASSFSLGLKRFPETRCSASVSIILIGNRIGHLTVALPQKEWESELSWGRDSKGANMLGIGVNVPFKPSLCALILHLPRAVHAVGDGVRAIHAVLSLCEHGGKRGLEFVNSFRFQLLCYDWKNFSALWLREGLPGSLSLQSQLGLM